MNELIVGLICTILGGAIAGIISSSTPQNQKTIVNVLFAITGGMVSTFAGYRLGHWQAQQNLTSSSEPSGGSSVTDPLILPEFMIVYPSKTVKSKDSVGGSFKNLSEKYERSRMGVWLYVYDGAWYSFYRIREVDTYQQTWRVSDVEFESSQSAREYELQVIWTNQEANGQVLAALQSRDKKLRQLPPGNERISALVTVRLEEPRVSPAASVSSGLNDSSPWKIGRIYQWNPGTNNGSIKSAEDGTDYYFNPSLFFVDRTSTISEGKDVIFEVAPPFGDARNPRATKILIIGDSVDIEMPVDLPAAMKQNDIVVTIQGTYGESHQMLIRNNSGELIPAGTTVSCTIAYNSKGPLYRIDRI